MNYTMLDNLCSQLYDHSCVGGPLHIVLDDGNLDDDCINYCENNLYTHYEPSKYEPEGVKVITDICEKIISLLKQMSEEEREVWYSGLESRVCLY